MQFVAVWTVLCVALLSVAASPQPDDPNNNMVMPFCEAHTAAGLVQLPTVPSVQTKHRSVRVYGLRSLPDSPVPQSTPLTLATQLNVNPWRFERLKSLLGQWGGPVAVGLSICTTADVEDLQAFADSLGPLAPRLHLRLLVPNDGSPLVPINVMRNIALSAVPTPWVMSVDIDIALSGPMASYWYDVESVSRAVPGTSENRTLFIVPAFEPSGELLTNSQGFVPKPMAKALFGEGKLAAMHPDSPSYRGYFNHKEWLSLSRTVHVPYSDLFEPYFIAKAPFPTYDVQYSGRGWNKASLFVRLYATGWQMWTLTQSLVVDVPHCFGSEMTKCSADDSSWDPAVHFRMALQYQSLMQKYNVPCPPGDPCTFKKRGSRWIAKRKLGSQPRKR